MSSTVAVRALCEFTARQGDLDLRFTPSPTSLEGIEGHAVVASRRGSDYQAEVSLSGEFEGLQVRGRADGYDPVRRRVEEIKTFRGDLSRQPANHRHLHWAQVRVYGWLLCQRFELPSIELALVYFDIGTQLETVFIEQAQADELRVHFEMQCGRFLAWAGQEAAHRASRDAWLGGLAFPHAAFRAGQRELAEAVYKAAKSGRCLVAQAPTGIGKTVGTLFPLLKACPTQQLDKVFYLSAKTSGRRMALDALALIQQGSPGNVRATSARLRVLELVARDKVCEHPDKACHGDSCPLARGFYDRLPAARLAAVRAAGAWESRPSGHPGDFPGEGAPNGPGDDDAANPGRASCAATGTTGDLHDARSGACPPDSHPGAWTQPGVRAIATAHGICPYYLSQELARWCDVAIGDYNHYFDLSAMLYALSQANQWRVAALVDEAHNLLERARRMHTAELDSSRLARLRHAAPAPLRKPLDRLHRTWGTMARAAFASEPGSYHAETEVPESFTSALQRCLAVLSDHFAETPASVDADLQSFYFDALRFSRLTDLFGDHSLFDLTVTVPAASPASRGKTPPTVACVRNVLPAPFLTPRLLAAHSVTLFSATLKPWEFHGETLGLPANTAFVDVASPFSSDQLAVHIARHISTRYRDRQGSLDAIVALMARQWRERPGNYLAFFSSHEYLGQVARAFAAAHPGIELWLQSPRMEEGEQARFIGRFIEGGRGIGFAVLGGSFSEGVDLPGDRLIGAFIATLGLPQINPVNEQFRQRLDRLLDGRGDAYTYLYPGLQKVVQAAGRVIRTTTDRGVVHLMDDRFQRAQVRRLLPDWWSVAGSPSG